jgi:hypothetical protein
MLAAIVSLMMLGIDTSVLTVPIVYAQEIDAKSVWIDGLADCESQSSTTIKILDTNGYYSYGLLMFQQKTWLSYGKKFGATKENIFDEELQRIVARSMLDNNGSGHWFNCNKKLELKIGKYPLDSFRK